METETEKWRRHWQGMTAHYMSGTSPTANRLQKLKAAKALASNPCTLIPAFVTQFDDDGTSRLIVDHYPVAPAITFTEAIKQIIGDKYIVDAGLYLVYTIHKMRGTDLPFGNLFQVTKDLEVIPGIVAQDTRRITRWPPK